MMGRVEIAPGDMAEIVPWRECRIGHPEIVGMPEGADECVGRVFMIISIKIEPLPKPIGPWPIATVAPRTKYAGYCAGCFRKIDPPAFEEPRRVAEKVDA